MDSHSSEDSAWYQNRQRKVHIDESEVSRFLKRIGRDLARGREFTVVIASNDAVRRANARFRGHRGSTDVLSFPDEDAERLGDILISAARAERQARDFGHRVEDEIKVLVLHGFVHLLGFDHAADNGEMERMEKKLRIKYGLQLGLVERAGKC